MKQLNFQIEIKATAEKVWKILWDDRTYREWTSIFSEGSYAESDWNEGSRILFLSPTGDGMYSRISKLIPEKEMAFEHLGIVKGFKEVPADEDSKKWSGAKEIYRLSSRNDSSVLLTVALDTAEDHEDYFLETFPRALQKVKDLCER